MRPAMVMTAAIQPRFDVPLELAGFGSPGGQENVDIGVEVVVAALHLNPNDGMLRALLHDPVRGPEVHTWSVVGLPRSLGRSWPLGVEAITGAFETTAMCVDRNGELWLAGLDDQDERPQFFRVAST
mmetsp:Transcript_21795/g.54965  ORF Transcript_21795/g.54965 Transcript_21795/m.54965 type:complete len:127 (-) Transcript_21795:192-572(-)